MHTLHAPAFRRSGWWMPLILLALLAPAPLSAQQAATSAASPELPAASELISRYVTEIGGRDALLQSGSMRWSGRVEIPVAGLEGTVEVLHAQPNLLRVVTTISGLGMMQRGFDGTYGWSSDPITGSRLMQGPELAAMRDQSQFLAAVRDPGLFAAMQTVEHTEMGGEPCYRVKLSWKSGRESFDCYSSESGLLVGTVETHESPMGSVEAVSLLGEYRRFGPLRTATRVRQVAMGIEQLLTIDAVEFGGMDAARIAPPAEIRALIAQEGGS